MFVYCIIFIKIIYLCIRIHIRYVRSNGKLGDKNYDL